MTETKLDRIRRELAELAAKYQTDPPRETPARCYKCNTDTTWGELRGDRYGESTVDGPYAFVVSHSCQPGVLHRTHQPNCPCGRCERQRAQRASARARGWDGE